MEKEKVEGGKEGRKKRKSRMKGHFKRLTIGSDFAVWLENRNTNLPNRFIQEQATRGSWPRRRQEIGMRSEA